MSMRHKEEYSNSSFESDSCDYSHDDTENGAAKHRQHAKKQHKKDKSFETETKSNLRKELNDDDQSVSDDSLEVIVVKRSLEKKCEKVVSGRRSKTPRECTKETKLTKTHKRSSKKMSKSSKSKIFNKDKTTVDRDESPDKKEKNVVIEEPKHSSVEEEESGSERITESRYRRDATDSTSQETVEQVIVTAMVHKDQMPDTPKSVQKTTKEISSDVLRESTTEENSIEETKEIFKDNDFLDKSKVALPHKTNTHDTSEEKLQQVTQESLQINKEVQDEEDKITMPVSIEDANIINQTQSKNLNVIIFVASPHSTLYPRNILRM